MHTAEGDERGRERSKGNLRERRVFDYQWHTGDERTERQEHSTSTCIDASRSRRPSSGRTCDVKWLQNIPTEEENKKRRKRRRRRRRRWQWSESGRVGDVCASGADWLMVISIGRGRVEEKHCVELMCDGDDVGEKREVLKDVIGRREGGKEEGLKGGEWDGRREFGRGGPLIN